MHKQCTVDLRSGTRSSKVGGQQLKSYHCKVFLIRKMQIGCNCDISVIYIRVISTRMFQRSTAFKGFASLKTT